MALFDATTLFFHTGNVYNFTSGEYVSLATVTGSTASTAVNLGTPRDLGIGPGAEIPQVVASIGTAITSSSASMLVNLQFQGSTNGVSFTTYWETGANSTASYSAGAVYTFDVPRRPPGIGLPQYYQLNFAVTGTGGVPTISTGTVLAGIVIAASESAGTLDQYSAGFTFPSGA